MIQIESIVRLWLLVQTYGSTGPPTCGTIQSIMTVELNCDNAVMLPAMVEIVLSI